MAPTHVELYEALKPTVGEEAAQMISEIVPAAENLATKLDIAATNLHIEREITQVKLAIAAVNERVAEMDGRLQAQIKDSSQQTIRWMLGFFVPVWLGSWGTVVAVLLRG